MRQSTEHRISSYSEDPTIFTRTTWGSRRCLLEKQEQSFPIKILPGMGKPTEFSTLNTKREEERESEQAAVTITQKERGRDNCYTGVKSNSGQ